MTRSAEPMLFVKIEDMTGSLEILVFPSLLKENNLIWQEGKVVLCQGKLSDKDQELKLLCNKVMELTSETAAEAINKFTASGNNKSNGGIKRFYPKASNGAVSYGYPSLQAVSSASQPAWAGALPAAKNLVLKNDKLFITLNGNINE